MSILVAGLVLWIGVHCVPMMVDTRTRLIDQLGENAYKGAFALTSLIGFGLIIWGKSTVDFVEIWMPAAWQVYATKMMMYPALVLIVAANGPDNSFRRILGHPMILGVELWAIAHLLVNGDLGSIILFGSFLLWALAAFASAIRRKPPLGGKAKRLNNAIVMGLAAVLYMGLLHGHEWIAGVALINP